MKRLQVVAILFAVGMVTVRLAWSDTEPIRIEYHAGIGCPSEQEFRKDVTSRAAQAAPRYGRDSRLFEVTMSGQDGHAYGRLQIHGNSGSTFTRDVTGENCNEVASALALVAALTIDSKASPQPSAIAITGAVSPIAVEPSASALPTAPNPPTQIFQSSHMAQSRVLSQEASFAPPIGPRSSVTWRWSAGIQGTSMFHIVPKTAFGGGYFVDLEPNGLWYIWPDFRLTATYLTTFYDTWEGSAGVGARWWWLLARAEVCPLRLATSNTSLILRTCASIDGGIITANGKISESVNTVTRGWSALGPALRLTWQTDVRLLFEIGSGLSFPLTHWNFTYRESGKDNPVAGTEHLGWTFGGGISYKWL